MPFVALLVMLNTVKHRALEDEVASGFESYFPS